MRITQRPVGRVPDGEVVEYEVASDSGALMRASSYGATLTSVRMPDRAGSIGEVTLAYPTAAEFLSTGNPPYFGVTVGRFANRIREGRFALDGTTHVLARNEDGIHHLHGGVRGFDKRLWRAQTFEAAGRAGVRFSYRSPDGEEGYPGALEVLAEYALDEDGCLAMSHEARTDRATVLNLTNHAYWNLAGSLDVRDHVLRLFASSCLEVDGDVMPTGRLAPVAGTAFDFRLARRVGERIEETGGGYDHCYVLDRPLSGGEPTVAAVLEEPESGRRMEVLTTQPGVQLYTGNFLPSAGFARHRALCLETQHYPDCVNHPELPSAVLRPGEIYRHTTLHRFSAG